MITAAKTNAEKNILIVSESSDAMKRILASASKEKLVIIIGTGFSMGLTNGVVPSWTGLIKSGFEYARKKGRVTDAQLNLWSGQMASSDIDDLLSSAEFVGRKLGAPNDQIYARWLQETFATVQPKNEQLMSALRSFVSLGIPICTLNYDPLLEIVTGLPSIQVSETSKVMAWMRRELPAILHLHGSWDIPTSCILGIRDYEATQTDEIRNLFQRHLAAFNHLLFIGCGDTLEDPNFTALINWLRIKLNASTLQHVALVREDDVVRRNADPAWLGFVEPISFGPNHSDLAEFLLKNFPQRAPKKILKKKERPDIGLAAVIENYRQFLLRDCGQMTIEGVSADMDTGQRKFDLERLFVPLDIAACPPDFSPVDPDAPAKLEEWKKKNSSPMPFGKILSKHKRMALLALPGGGKTLLLKRLAVAYAETSRRAASSDELPELNLLPVLIRCREWRDHIRLPINTLLKNIGDITGQSNFDGFADALTPLLKKGQVLLLVDGLDEIHSDADRATFVDHLESFLDEYKQIRLVVTSREAGFNLVAPSLSRFCSRWRVAPLNKGAITLLCAHWHRLMTGDTPAAVAEGQEVAEIILRKSSLRRLAENPLLLTMLLVVKHGAGGLPPDRVSLYGRAVDVLLDTWNIKGHDPLNAKEAVPQLAYVAFQLMCAGKQTATENEILGLLEEAREKHPNIKRYAKDSPYAFLKRVELRSSLLLEAGHQVENGKTVPFFQFRHLTFQEYLSAVAVTEGHYWQYHQDDTVLTPLLDNLLAEEWKEVIPMVAVLARKRAEPLLVELIARGNRLRRRVPPETADRPMKMSADNKLSGPAGRLIQCFIEEAEASPKTISSALQTVVYFARGCRSADDWETLCRGPYGDELYRQAWEILISKKWASRSWLMNTCASIAVFRRPLVDWLGEPGRSEIKGMLRSKNKEEVGHGLLIIFGILWINNDVLKKDDEISELVSIDLVEPFLFNEDYDISSVAIWIWTNGRRRQESPRPVSLLVLKKLFSYWIEDFEYKRSGLAAYALGCQVGIDRDFWCPKLTKAQRLNLVERFNYDDIETGSYQKTAAFFIAYHSKNVWSDTELIEKLEIISDLRPILVRGTNWDKVAASLGVKILDKRASRKSKSRIVSLDDDSSSGRD